MERRNRQRRKTARAMSSVHDTECAPAWDAFAVTEYTIILRPRGKNFQ
jgi:hypothetical protein